MSKRSIAAALVGAALTISAIGTSAAYAYPADCTGGKVCLYDYYDFVGQLGWRAAGVSLANISSANNDKMASWANSTSTNAAWYEGLNGSGTCHTMSKQSQNSALDIFTRDTASSWKTNGGC
ncbi:peptidase inhibitor family I36 protein [Microbacterium luticocti]|uniref:peptidase inhibitor family I36 protein n=1 Tax=Microbacterium luticocti TaxID=451764 RepID=UPI000A06289F|nr:peptidase inhibitor family I36 protein [Microbacterium luticocti]